MQTLPKVSGGREAYEFYIEMMLQWRCKECQEFIDAAADIRREEEPGAPHHGPWAARKAQEAMRLGWYVQPLTENGSLVPFCLCPSCSVRRGLTVKNEVGV
jgi:hypothetical protein